MQTPSLETAVRRIRTLATPLDASASDRDLLRRFLACRDEGAFAEIVARHGPMVFGVCHRVLNNRHDAEDAFQAAFLVLARRADAIRKVDSLSCWLHGVAFRVASKLKSRLSKQPRSIEVPDSPAPGEDLSWREVRRTLDEEVNRLPERWRSPVLLCCFEGKTRDEAAESLGWKLSTLKGRLEDGRNQLRIRLAKRGVELSAALLAISAVNEGRALPESLLRSTLQAISGHASKTALTLARGAAIKSAASVVKISAATLILALGLGITLFAFRGEAGESPEPKRKDEPAPRKADLPEELLAMMQAADRVWVVDEPTDKSPIPEPAEVLKGQSPPDAGYSFRYKVEALKDLPRNGHRWIVFLKSIEEVDHIPKVEKLPGKTWFLPADEKTVTQLRAYVPPCVWSETKGGLRFGIWPRSGEEPTVELVLQNDGEKEFTIPQFRGNYWDDWSPISFAITTPAGKTYNVVRHGAPLKDGDAPRTRVLKPGERYIHVVRLNRWIVPAAKDRGFGLTNGGAPEGLFAAGGDFQVKASYHTANGPPEPGVWNGSLETKPVTVRVPKHGHFGEPSGELSLRLRQPAPIPSGDDPTLVVDLRHSGKSDRRVNGKEIHTEIEVDGIWYRAISDKELSGIREVELKASSELAPFLTVKPDRTWLHLRVKPGSEDDPDAPKEAIPFRLTPGAHTIRVSYRFSETERPISNPVTIEVSPDGWGDSSGGVKSRLRLSKPRYFAGEPLAFELDLKNVSRRNLKFSTIPFNASISVDGRWYVHHGDIDYKSIPTDLKPGEETRVAVNADSAWKTNQLPAKGDNTAFDPLTLTPGRHKVKVIYVIEAGKIEPTSNELEFEVLGIDPSVGKLADGTDRIWVVNAPTEKQPIPLAVEVLKGPRLPEAKVFDLRLLPGDDPKKRFIVFLRANEDGRGVPELKRLDGDVWFKLYSEELARTIRKSIEPSSWGEEKGGLRMGMRLRQSMITLGEPVVVELSVNNAGAKDVSLYQHRLNIYDYWPELHFDVTMPDGSKWTLWKSLGAMDEADSAHAITLKPGESYVQTVPLDRWAAIPTVSKIVKRDGTRFNQAGEYKLRASMRYSQPLQDNTYTVTYESPELRLVMINPDDWGPERSGLKARVRPTKAKFVEGDPLEFELDLKNLGKEIVTDSPIPFMCRIQFDGEEYAYQLPVSYPTGDVKIEPGKERVPHVKVSAAGDGSWKFVPPFTDTGGGPNAAKSLELKPGKHKLTVSYPVPGLGNQFVRSQMVEFEVTKK